MSSNAWRELLEGLLDLHEHEDPSSLLPAALELLLRVVGAARGYVELEDGDSPTRHGWHATNCEASLEDRVRTRISRGVLAEALATGRVVQTTSAIDDPRFATRESVRENQLEAILCAPVQGARVRGAVYVEGRTEPGPFTEDDERAVERLARVLASRGDALCDREDREHAGHADTIPGVIGASASMRAVLAKLRACAGIDVLVLLTGPSGTGKTMLARALHDLSPRSAAPFIEVNCAALPEALFESELFGAARGAHSAVAHGAVEGKIAAAERGTLFLDEVAELPMAAQAKLLSFLQSRSYHRLGDGAARTADVRVVAASNADLDRAVEERRLREDLLHRLRVIEIALPTLEDRPEDVAPLARALCERVKRRHGTPRLSLSPASVAALGAAAWPGNARQLENAIERGAIQARMEGRSEICPRDLFGEGPSEAASSLDALLHDQRGRIVRAVLEEVGWNVREAAARLDVARSHLYKLIAVHGLSRPSS